MSLVQALLAIFLPPVSVFLHRGVGFSLLLNIVLWILGWIPGSVHAIMVLMNDEA